jgi:hypothetical protein
MTARCDGQRPELLDRLDPDVRAAMDRTLAAAARRRRILEQRPVQRPQRQRRVRAEDLDAYRIEAL